MSDIRNCVLVDYTDDDNDVEHKVDDVHYYVLPQDKTLIFFVEVLLLDAHFS